jgi:hypothetical protein
MRKQQLVIVIALVLVAAGAFLLGKSLGYKDGYNEAGTEESGYEACVKAGNEVALSDPPQCRDDKGLHYGP